MNVLKRSFTFFCACTMCAVLALSCASSLPYGIDYPLSEQTVRSRDGVFRGVVPRGWFSSNGDTDVPGAVAWLVKDDETAAISIRELKLDPLSKKRVEEKGLSLLAHVSAGLQLAGMEGASLTAEPKEFEMRGKRFCSYELTAGDGEQKRVVVFPAKGGYYECEAGPVRGMDSVGDIKDMFTAQQSFLASLTF